MAQIFKLYQDSSNKIMKKDDKAIVFISNKSYIRVFEPWTVLPWMNLTPCQSLKHRPNLPGCETL